jgi:hypothetical protein
MTSRHAASVCPCPRYTYGGKKGGEKVLTAPLYHTPQLPAQGAAHRRNLGCCCISRHHAEVAENPRKPGGTREFCVARTCWQPVHPVVAGGGRVLTSPQQARPPTHPAGALQRGSTLPRGGCELTPARVRPLPRAVRLRHRPLMPGTCGRSQPRTPHRWRGRGNGVGGKPSVARRGAAPPPPCTHRV